jgi:hypothetical protein
MLFNCAEILDPEINFGPQTDSQQFSNIQKFLDRAESDNSKLLLDDRVVLPRDISCHPECSSRY